MTPRTIEHANGASPPENELDRWIAEITNFAAGAVNSLSQLLARCQLKVAEDSHSRLTAVRAFLDRAEGIRFELAEMLLHSRGVAAQVTAEADWTMASAAMQRGEGLVARGLAADERRWRYQMGHRPAIEKAQEVSRAIRMLEDADRTTRDQIQAIDRHRLEALTLLRAGLSVSADEYAFHSAETQPEGTAP